MRSAVTGRWYSATIPSIVEESQRDAVSARTSPHVDSDDRSACLLHALDHLALDSERADESIEVGDDDHVGFACLQHRDCTAHARTAIEWRTAGDVRLLQRVDELEPVALAGGPDTLSLLGRRDKALAITVTDAADADDPNGSTYGGALAD